MTSLEGQVNRSTWMRRFPETISPLRCLLIWGENLASNNLLYIVKAETSKMSTFWRPR